MNLVLNSEAARLEALHQYQILDTSPEEAFDDLAILAAQICNTPIALINLIDANRQWFKAKIGIDAVQMPREIGFSSACLDKGDVFVVNDALLDERFATSPLVIGEPYVRFYASVPLKTAQGHIIGTLCVLDSVPKEITQKQIDSLRSLARLVMRQLDIRQSLGQLAAIQSDYRQAKDALHESEHILSSFFNSTAMMMGIVELRDDDILHISDNTAAANFFGLSPEAMHNRFASDFGVSKEHIREWIGYYQEAFRTQAPVKFEYKFDSFQEERWLYGSVNAIACCNNSYNYQKFAYIVEDITESKRAEQKIRERSTLLDATTDAIVLRDLSNNILLWNKSAEKLYGWQSEEVIGQNAQDILYASKVQQYEKIYNTVLEKGSWHGELLKQDKAGLELVVESRWTLILDEWLQPKSILSVDTDITHKKQLETQFLRAQRMESIGTLASGIAHDLNNVLSPILMAVHLLKSKCHDEHNLQMLTIVENNAKRSANLVKQVLSFARGMSGDRTTIQLQVLIAEIQQIIEQTFPKSIALHTQIQPNLFPICGDNTQLHQVLINLCLNARDAMPDGGILKITADNVFIDEHYASMHLDAKVGSYVLLTIADTGVGIPNKFLDRIFEPFFTTKDFGKGTGLGLSTAIGIIKGHGGFVNVSSCVGSTEFKVYLPTVIAEVPQQLQESQTPPGNGELILVVDDEPAIREITRTLLENHNYQVITANDGIEAIALYAQYKRNIKAAIIDMMMPNMDGSTTINTLYKMNSSLPIITVSGLASSEQVPLYKESNRSAFLPKPYTAQELFKTLHQLTTSVPPH